MSSSVSGQNQTQSIGSPQTTQQPLRIEPRGQTGRLKTMMRSLEREPAAIRNAIRDPRPAFSAWWERWRESRTRFHMASITRQTKP